MRRVQGKENSGCAQEDETGCGENNGRGGTRRCESTRLWDGRAYEAARTMGNGGQRGTSRRGQWATVNKEVRRGQWTTVAKVSRSASKS
jgi:hypothetical protein